jgi:TetR/AcrR family transcriptional regulator
MVARPRSADYDDKRLAILRRGAELFARNGYDRTSMSEIALALGVSKALFYHYYRAKDDLLFDIIRSHLLELVEAVELADDPALPAEQRLGRLVCAILDCYRDADAEHKVQINHLGQLAPERQNALKELERRLVEALAAVIAALNPDMPAASVKPLTMSIFGTLNWKYMWFREDGPVSRGDYAAMLTRMFAAGIAGLASSDDASSAQ